MSVCYSLYWLLQSKVCLKPVLYNCQINCDVKCLFNTDVISAILIAVSSCLLFIITLYDILYGLLLTVLYTVYCMSLWSEKFYVIFIYCILKYTGIQTRFIWNCVENITMYWLSNMHKNYCSNVAGRFKVFTIILEYKWYFLFGCVGGVEVLDKRYCHFFLAATLDFEIEEIWFPHLVYMSYWTKCFNVIFQKPWR